MRLWNALLVVATVSTLLIALPVAAQNEPADSSSASSETDGASAETSAPSAGTGTGPAAAAESGAGQPSGPSGTPEGAAAESMPIDGSTYAVRLRDLEARVDELKEQIRRSHTRLSLLSDTILSGGVGGARAEITFKNEMSSAFQLTRALFVLDGAVQYNKQDDTGTLAAQTEIPIFSGSIPPGDHTLQVLVQLRGHGYGVFSYLRGYKFEVKSSHSFTITEGKTIELEAVAWEKGGVTTPLEQRPAVRYTEKIRTGTAGSQSAPASGQQSPVQGSTSVSAGTK